MSPSKIVTYSRVISLGLFGLACILDAYCTANECVNGTALLIGGIFGIFTGGAALAWLANPFIFLSWIIYKHPALSLFLSLVGLGIAFSFSFADQIITNEAGHYAPIIKLSIGYWLWTLSMLSMVVGNFLLIRKHHVKRN